MMFLETFTMLSMILLLLCLPAKSPPCPTMRASNHQKNGLNLSCQMPLPANATIMTASSRIYFHLIHHSTQRLQRWTRILKGRLSVEILAGGSFATSPETAGLTAAYDKTWTNLLLGGRRNRRDVPQVCRERSKASRRHCKVLILFHSLSLQIHSVRKRATEKSRLFEIRISPSLMV